MNIFRKIFNRKEEKASETAGALGFIAPGGEVWSTKDYENFAKEAYMKNIIAFRAIDMITKSIASVPWGVYRDIDENKELVEQHPVMDVIDRPNPTDSFSFLVLEIFSYYLLAGNSFIEKVGASTGINSGIPKELYILHPNRVKIIIDKETGLIEKYVYSYGGDDIEFPVDQVTGNCDILHLRSFHPNDDYWGLSRVEVGSYQIDTDNSSTKWNKRLLDNQARPGMILMFQDHLTDKQLDRIKATLKEMREGPQNAGKSLVLEAAKDVKPYGFSPTEMDFINSNRELARKICFLFGVPSQLMGIPGDSTYNNMQEARAMFWEDTVIPYLDYFKGELNQWLFKKEAVYLDYDLSGVFALAHKKDKLWERAQGSDFLTINEKRELAGYEPVEGGDVILVSATMIPLGMEVETEEDIEKEEDEVKSKLKFEGYDGAEIETLMDVDYEK
jgi:HK97 family phage portal protein